jgi:hypothetical protein
MENVGIFFGHLVYFTANWFVLQPFGIFPPILACCVDKNLATLPAIIIFVRQA